MQMPSAQHYTNRMPSVLNRKCWSYNSSLPAYMIHIFFRIISLTLISRIYQCCWLYHSFFSPPFFLLIYFASDCFSLSPVFPGVRREDRKLKELPGRSPPVHISVGAWLNKRVLRERKRAQEKGEEELRLLLAAVPAACSIGCFFDLALRFWWISSYF